MTNKINEFDLNYAKKIWSAITSTTKIITDFGEDKAEYTVLGCEGTETIRLIECNYAAYAKWGYAPKHDTLIVIEANFPHVDRVAIWNSITWGVLGNEAT